MLTLPATDISRPHTRLLALLLILGLGWVLRTHQLDDRSLWADEGWTMVLSEGPRMSDVTRTLADDQHPPLFFALFRVWRNVAGDTEFATRYASVLIGMIAIAVTYQLGRTLYGVRTGVLAALLLALADLHIDLSQEVRHYSLLATLTILSSLFYARWWRTPNRTNRIGYVLSSVALLYTHYLGGYILIAQLVHMLITMRPLRRLANALFLFGSICATFIPWFLVMLNQNRVRWDNPLYYQNALPNNSATYRMIRTAILGQHYALLGLLVLLGLVYLIVSHNTGTNRLHLRLRPLWPAAYLVMWIAVMVGITVAINAQREFLTVRNFIVIIPALALLAAHGLANLRTTARGFMVVLILVISLTTVDSRRNYPNWRAVTHNVTAYHLDHEPVLMDVWVGDFPVRYYVKQQMGDDTPAISLREWRGTYREMFLPTLLEYVQRVDAFWLVYWGNDPMEYGDILTGAGFQRTATLSVNHQGTPLYSYRYDHVTDNSIAQFGDLFALQKSFVPAQAAAGDTLQVMLWWRAKQPVPLDYSVSVFVLDSTGALVAQHDGPPLNGNSPTSSWKPDTLYYDVHTIPLPDTLPAGGYQLGVKVYWYGDNQPLPATRIPAPESGDTADYIILGQLDVMEG